MPGCCRRVEPGTDYVARAGAERSDGEGVTKTRRFHTEDLTLAGADLRVGRPARR